MTRHQHPLRRRLQPLKERMLAASLRTAADEAGLSDLVLRLQAIEPDVTDQYSQVVIQGRYLETKVRVQQAFQVQSALEALERIAPSPGEALTIIDIGDSSGRHLHYLDRLLDQDGPWRGRPRRLLGVNIDPVAIDKIRRRGYEAVLCRAEALYRHLRCKADLITCFQTLEHLSDPVQFLDALSLQRVTDWMLVTVPFLNTSRVGLHHIRARKVGPVSAETTHVFELAPTDWRLLFQHAGWRIAVERVFRQYPSRGWLRLTRSFWRLRDFEGFYAAILRRDRRWADCYQ
jgi:hypothetical protein